MGSDTTFYENLIHGIKMTLHTIAPAKVLLFNEVKQTATIELLFLPVDKDGNVSSYSPIEDVPVLGMRYKANKSYEAQINGSTTTVRPITEIEYIPHLKKGDVVFVGFAERSLDQMNGTKKFDPLLRRTHDIRDAVVLGVLF